MKQQETAIDFEYEGDSITPIANKDFPKDTIGWQLVTYLEGYIAEAAIQNCLLGHDNLYTSCHSVYDAIDRAFQWESSVEGHNYWENIRAGFEESDDDDDDYDDEDDYDYDNIEDESNE